MGGAGEEHGGGGGGDGATELLAGVKMEESHEAARV